jgi:hypothetical protein
MRFAPKDYPIEYQQIIARDDEGLDRRTASVRSLKEAEAMDWPPPRTPWWCGWRRLVR